MEGPDSTTVNWFNILGLANLPAAWNPDPYGRSMQIFAEFDSHENLLREFEENLGKARAFVLGEYDVSERQAVELILIHPVSGEWLPLKAEVVYIAPKEQAAVGLEIIDFTSERSALIQSFIGSAAEEVISLVSLDPPQGEQDGLPPPSSSRPLSERSIPPPKNVQERVRKLNVRERDAMARGGTLSERVALERAYGAVVWDGLLSNAALTAPEVARIAKNGNATLPHLTLIVSNPAWLTKGEVRRALLTNPRLTEPQIERVLRALTPAELKALPKQTAYAPKVRAAAMRILSR